MLNVLALETLVHIRFHDADLVKTIEWTALFYVAILLVFIVSVFCSKLLYGFTVGYRKHVYFKPTWNEHLLTCLRFICSMVSELGHNILGGQTK